MSAAPRACARAAALLALLSASAWASAWAPARAHDGVEHRSAAEARAHLAAPEKGGTAEKGDAAAQGPATPFPADIGGPFRLRDQFGRVRTEADPDGRMQLLFFGYAECQAICTAALPMMAEAARLAAEAGIPITPVLITVDPARDTPEALRRRLPALHEGMLGLTGSEAALKAARDAFGVERRLAFEHPDYGAVFSHGSFIYLLDGAGEVLSVLPPILSAEQGARIAARYAAAAAPASPPGADVPAAQPR